MQCSQLFFSAGDFLPEPLRVLVDVDHETFVLGFADLFDIVEHLDFERELAPVDAGKLDFGADLLADRRRRHVADIHGQADLPLAGLEMRRDQLVRRHLDEQHHRRGRKHLVFAARGGELLRDLPYQGVFHSDFQGFHFI